MDENYYLKLAQEGDIEAFETIISTYQKKVYNIAYRMTGNKEDASELAQEVFIKVYKSIKNFKGNSSLSTWIYRIASNTCLDHLRKTQQQNTTSIDQSLELCEGEVYYQIRDLQPAPEEVLERKELTAIISDAINTLTPDNKMLITLRDIQGFKYEQIAQLLNCPEGTVKSRINRARQALKNKLYSYYNLKNPINYRR